MSRKEVEKKIDQAVKQVLTSEQIEEFKSQILQQLKEARAKKLYWIRKEIELVAIFGACDQILKLPEINKEVKHHE